MQTIEQYYIAQIRKVIHSSSRNEIELNNFIFVNYPYIKNYLCKWKEMNIFFNDEMSIWKSFCTNFSWLGPFFSGKTYEKRDGMKEPDHFGETVSDWN